MNLTETNTEGDGPEPASLSIELRRALDLLLDAWFPRCMDTDHGGFLCDFDAEWNAHGAQDKMLEYQARVTRTAAQVADTLGKKEILCDAARHGFRYLSEVMWDPDHGGWFRMLDRSGAPLEAGMKHGHGTSYAIAACVECYKLIGDAHCLDLAMQGFDWMERHARDRQYGGYFPAYLRDGTAFRELGAVSSSGERDPLDIPYGLKDHHTLVDLMDAFADLYAATRSARVHDALDALFHLLRDRLVVPPGASNVIYTADWRPLPAPLRYAHSVQLASILLKTSRILNPASGAESLEKARSLVDCTLRYAWDKDKGGIIYCGSAFGRTVGDGIDMFSARKVWWSQAETLRSLAVMAESVDDDALRRRYLDYFCRCWQYVKTFLIDTRHYGWREEGLDTNPGGDKPKANAWKDLSHEATALLESIRCMDRLAE